MLTSLRAVLGLRHILPSAKRRLHAYVRRQFRFEGEVFLLVTLEDLIRKGYFPEEIIPPFTTEGLADLISVLVPQLSTWERKISKCCSHTIPRLKHLRRHLSIPNPINQILLCKVIEDHWTEINQFVSSSSLSMSTPKVKIDSKRAVERAFPFDQIAVERVLNKIKGQVFISFIS